MLAIGSQRGGAHVSSEFKRARSSMDYFVGPEAVDSV